MDAKDGHKQGGRNGIVSMVVIGGRQDGGGLSAVGWSQVKTLEYSR